MPAVSGLAAPLVHGMWLSATAQYAVQALDEKGAHYEIAGWTYNMYGMVQLDDEVEISIERVGRVAHAGMVLEVTSRIDGNIVSRGTAIVRAPKSAFVYPGQGIQKQGMVLDERAKSPAAREVWERADKVTREKLGFSILAVVRDNPKELTANGVTYRHPEGLLNLTQFTQVALATVAFAQTARLREAGADIWPAYFAGHSLGEYNALSSFAGVIPLETVIDSCSTAVPPCTTSFRVTRRVAPTTAWVRCVRTSSVWATTAYANTSNPCRRLPASSCRS